MMANAVKEQGGDVGPGKVRFVCRWAGDFKTDTTGVTTYEGGETRLCTVPKIITFSQLVTKLRDLTGFGSTAGYELVLKYQVPGGPELLPLNNNRDLDIFKEQHDAAAASAVNSPNASLSRMRMFVRQLPRRIRTGNEGSTSGDSTPASPHQASSPLAVAQGNDTMLRPTAGHYRVDSEDLTATPEEGSAGSHGPATPVLRANPSPHFRAAPPAAEGSGGSFREPAASGGSSGSPPVARPTLDRAKSSLSRGSVSTGGGRDDGSSSGEEDGGGYSESSSDSDEDAAPAPATHKSSKFAAETLSEVAAVLGRQRSGEAGASPLTSKRPSGEKVAADVDDEAIEKCLNEVEAALNAGLNFKGKLSWAGPGLPPGELAVVAAAPQPQAEAPAAKRKVSIMIPGSSAGAAPGATGNNNVAAAVKPPPRLAVGSGMATGEWSEGQWQEGKAEAVPEVPATLQQINADDLEKIKELGRGQFGSVWLCRWLGVEVAVKELHGTATVQSTAEMLGEATTLALLRHPCVIAFYGVVVNQESPASVLEYVRGSSLRGGLQKLKGHGVLSKRVRAAIALQAARGMEYLHSRRVVHFDLKCDNLLCDLRDTNRPVVKIGDLGLSKKKAATFVSGNMRGTLPWMAPELFPSTPNPNKQREGGEDRVTEKVDVFSFGVCMWEIWTLGETPYPGMSLPEIFAGVMNGTLRPSRPADCSAEWLAVMQACWHTQPSRRPTFSQIAAGLDALVQMFDDAPPPPPSK